MRKLFPRAVLLLVAIGAISGCGRRDEPRTLTIAFSNDMRGEIRSCGCAAEDLGGLGRRATFLSQVRDTTRDFLLLEGGDFFSSELNYGREKAELTLRSMGLMGYDGVVIGETDLGFGLDFLVEKAKSLGLPIVAANLHDAATDTLLFPATREVTLRSGLRVGIVGLVSARLKLPPQVPAESVRIVDPIVAVSPIVETLRGRVDLVVVLAHMTQDEMQRVAKHVDGIDLIVFGHDARAIRKMRRVNGAFPLQVADRGRYMGLAFAVLGADNRILRLDSNPTPLSGYYPDNEAVAKLFRSFDLSIAAKEGAEIPLGVLEARAGIDEPYEGAESCEPCHTEVYEHWAGTKHAHAFDILVNASREYDRDCTPCHTTGFYRRGGFENLNLTPDLINVQCEACHGNGHDHADDPEVKTADVAADVCRSCHTTEQTPDFDFETYWARIEHPGGGAGAGR